LDADRRIRDQRLIVFEPHPHPGLPDRAGHRGRRKLGSVVFDVEPLPMRSAVIAFIPSKGWERLEDDDFLIAVHTLDAKAEAACTVTPTPVLLPSCESIS
jgi:hypothetical protein